MPLRSYAEIKQFLIRRDRKLRPLIQHLNYPVARRNRDIYATLLQSIIAQQLSVKAADSIYARVLDLFPARYPDPVLLNKISISSLRQAGLSRQKSDYLKAIALYALEQGLDYQQLKKLSDSQLLEQLTQIRGVGQWTIEMLLIFGFHRRDVFSVTDVGIQNAMQRLYHINKSGKQLGQAMLDIAESWRPYRSIVCRYLWQWKSKNYF